MKSQKDKKQNFTKVSANEEAPSKIITTTAECWLGEDGIIRSVLKKNAVENIETAKENTNAGVKLSGGIKRPVLFDMTGIRSMDRAARDYYSHPENRESGDKAVAIIIDSPVSRVIGNFFLGLNKPLAPTQLFTDEEKALEWLKTLI